MSEFHPHLGAFWGPRGSTLGEYTTQVRAFLEGLRKLHPAFQTWYMLGDRMSDEKPLGVDLEHLDALLLESSWDRNAPKDRFTHLDSDGHPTSDSTVRVGWISSFVTEPEAQRTRNYVHALMVFGGTHPKLPNSVSLSVRDPSSPLLDPVLSDRVFRYLIEFWKPDRALATDSSYRDVVEGPEQLGWLNYRADASFAGNLPEEVSREMFHGGVLFRIGDGRALAENDTTEVRLGQHIQRAVLDRE